MAFGYTTIGNLAVVKAGTKNPYRAGVFGDERIRALGLFLRGKATPGYDIWLAPSSGGARTLKSVKEIKVDADSIDYSWHKDGTPKKRSRGGNVREANEVLSGIVRALQD